MPIVIALLALVGAVCLLDLVLTFGVIRRLREHSAALAALSTPPAAIAAPGEPVGAYAVVTTDGEAASDADLTFEPTLVGFFSPSCPACAEHLPRFVEAAKNHPYGRDHVLAVVAGDPGETAEQQAALHPVARVVVENRGEGVMEALRVRAFPAFALVGTEKKVLASGGAVADVLVAKG
ncbi:hypothetical protein Aph01nite_35220 [Acrocarpospora phusangensis]|uniref:Thioredoxin domain-containing protein n=1 Tax=Acrocarpospora phusangensis TaxID=1070424 RepID=A0A919QFB6_9ACTN|nr:hypothetical protein [Acrocarpospora phusangensis]GIH25212.1 hypothetical protein Aph01nite_35220 [Acrocarpospora phusangensis]